MLRSVRATRALSRSPLRLMRVKISRTSRVPTTAGKGKVSSPARYEMAVAAETTDVAAKSNSNRAAPIRAMDLEDTFSLSGVQVSVLGLSWA